MSLIGFVAACGVHPMPNKVLITTFKSEGGLTETPLLAKETRSVLQESRLATPKGRWGRYNSLGYFDLSLGSGLLSSDLCGRNYAQVISADLQNEKDQFGNDDPRTKKLNVELKILSPIYNKPFCYEEKIFFLINYNPEGEPKLFFIHKSGSKFHEVTYFLFND